MIKHAANGVLLMSVLSAGAAGPVTVSARKLPVAAEVDVLVLGGTTAGVVAAVEAAEKGASVLLAAPRHYLGEDLCDTLRLWVPTDAPLDDPLMKAMFARDHAPGCDAYRLATPMQIKKALDDALIAADVRFLFGCYPSAVLTDGRGREVTGVILANRAGRQLVKAKAVIDATTAAAGARLAGRMRPSPRAARRVRRVVVGGEAVRKHGNKVRELPFTIPDEKNRPLKVFEYTLELPLDESSPAAMAEAEQLARDRTWHPDAEEASGRLRFTPRKRIIGVKGIEGDWPGADKADLDAFRFGMFSVNLHVVGPCADISDAGAEALDDVAERIALGRRLGRAVGAEAANLREPSEFQPAWPNVLVREFSPRKAEGEGQLRELLGGLRPATEDEMQALPAHPAAVLGEYDVVVIGAGASGAPAAIAAARRGAKVLAIEYQHRLGGTGTVGLIGRYWHGYRGGFTAEVDRATARGKGWDVDRKAEWWRSEIRKAGGDIWLGCLGAGALVDEGRVRGVAVATSRGYGVVRAKVVVDSTGAADIAAAAGAECIYTGAAFLAVQGAGLPPHEPGADYTNTDFHFADETDMLDVWRLFVHVRRRYAGTFDHAALIDSRDRRRIVGDVVLSLPEILAGRTWSDTIALGRTNFDTHGYTVEPLLFLSPPDKRSLDAWMPYRMLLPRGLDGILVTGLGASAHRDAIPLVRMQADLQNQGYAAGLAAADAAKKNLPTRSVDVEAIQKHLVEIGQIPEKVLDHTDGMPIDEDDVAEAVEKLGESYHRAAVVLTHPRQAKPLLIEAMKESDGETKTRCAQALAILGDGRGLEVLLDAIDAHKGWDEGWNFRGMGQFGPSVSPLDSLIIAAGFVGDDDALPAILRKIEQLDAGKAFSHHRAVAIALERIGDAAAAEPLATLLGKKGMTGHTIDGPEAPRDRSPALREIILARALWRLGDHEGVAKRILSAYTKDLRGHFARHAAAVLNAGK